ncbi:MAG: DUF4381 family protein [Verrucomicrobiaceae bacterium]|nr:DUF4381 family protein [Verrucomicrobiaceae bacterium]
MPQLPGAPPLPHKSLPPMREVPPPPVWWLPWLIGVLVLGLLGFILWLMLRPKAAVVIPPRQPISSALRALNDLRSRVQSIPPHEMSHRVSLILRRYLGERYAVPATARTTEEIFSHLRQFEPGVPVPRAEGAWKERFAPVARLCDDMSFMPAPRTTEESLMLVDLAARRVEEERI